MKKPHVHHTAALTVVSIGYEATSLTRLETEDLRQRLVPPEGQQRREFGVGDNQGHERLYGLSAGHVLTDRDAQDLHDMLQELNDLIGDNANAHHMGRLAAFREIGGDMLVAAAEGADRAMSDAAVASAMKKFRESAAKYDAKRAAIEGETAVDATPPPTTT